MAHECLAGDEEVMSGAGRAQGGAGLRVRGDRAGAPSSSPPTGATSAHHRGGCDPQTLVQQGGATPGHRRVPWPRLSACSHPAGLRQGGLGAGGAGGDMCGRMMAVSPDSAFRFFQMEISR